MPEVGVLRAAEPVGDAAQAAGGVVAQIFFPRCSRDVIGEEQFAVFGGEKKQEAIDDAEELA